MARLTTLLTSFVVLFVTIVGVCAAPVELGTPTAKEETNAERLARGLNPLTPKKLYDSIAALRPRWSNAPKGKCAAYGGDAFTVRVQTDVGHVIGWLSGDGKPDIVTSKSKSGCYKLVGTSAPYALTLLTTPATIEIKSPDGITDWSPSHSPALGPAATTTSDVSDNATCQADIWTVDKDDDTKLLASWKDASGKTDALKLVEVEDDDDISTFGAEFTGDSFGNEIFFFKDYSS